MSLEATDQLVHATLIYLIKDGKTLMIHRIGRDDDLHRDKYNGLGGKIEPGETPLEGAIREMKEESGLEIRATDMGLYGTVLFPKFDKKGRDWFVFIYKAFEYSGELNVENKEGRLEWIENDQLLTLNLWEGDRFFLKNLYSKTQFDGSLQYLNGKLKDHRCHYLQGED